MKFLDFFIDRPVTATIINLMLIVCGVLAFRGLLLEEYPRIIVPKIKVQTVYRNASPETVEKEITGPIEEGLSLVEGVETILSSSRNSVSEVRLRFSPNVSMDRAVMQVSEQLARIAPTLPEDAETPQIKRGDDHGDAMMYLGVKSNVYHGAALTHFTKANIKSHFQSIDGVAEVEVMGAPYAMNVTIDPLSMHNQRVGPHQIVKVLKQNELMLQAGRMRTNEPVSLDVVAKEPKDYERMIVSMNGTMPVRVADVAEVDLVDDDKDQKIRLDGQNAILIGITKAPDGNDLVVADAIYAMVDRVNKELRGQAEVTVESDHSIFVRSSLKTIFHTIFEACILVILIIFLFLRHLRATLVPLVTIPISLIATFFAIKIFGLSINTITMLAMVLAVGLVVDDAIVVLENIFRFKEQGMSAIDAAKKGAGEIGFAIVAMTCTLMSVFLPLAFISDITGAIMREFAITLASAVLFSGIVALTLSPVMCASVLRAETKEGRIGQSIENAFKKTEVGYLSLLERAFSKRKPVFLGVVVLALLGIFLFTRLDSDLLPKEDRGIIGAFIPLVPGFDLDDMEPYAAQVEQIFLKRKDVEKTLVMGFSEGMNVIAMLKPWSERSLHAQKIVAEIRKELLQIPTISAYPWSWDVGLAALRENSHDGAIMVALKTVGSYEDLAVVAQNLADAMRKDDVLIDSRSDLDINEKAYSIKMLREPTAALGVDERTVSLALQAYVNRVKASELKLEGQRYSVYLQPDVPVDDLNAVYISTKSGELVPLTTVAKVKREVQAPILKHLNQMRTATVFASLGEGKSLSNAKDYLDNLVKDVPKNISVSYEGALSMHKKSGQTFLLLFFAGLIFIFAVMAIQFEAIIDPLIILVTVPFACIGGVLILFLTGNGTNLYTQVGMLTLVGLITKHGILLTEFVGQKRNEGIDIKDAVFLAAKLRFRPIVMTTAATVLGALPLVLTRGAGVEARASIGLVVVGGMIFGTILTLFVLPLAIYSVYSLKHRWLLKKARG